MGREGNNIRGGIRRIQLKGDRRRKNSWETIQGSPRREFCWKRHREDTIQCNEGVHSGGLGEEW